MKKNILFIVIIFCVCARNLYSGVRDVNGTVGIQYVNYNQVFPKGDSLAKGFVRLSDGFTIAHMAKAQLDTFITVSGGMDIRNTGTLDLLSDLYLSSNFTFSTYDTIGGYIKGRGNTIHFGGNVKLQEGKMLQFIDDTIIDGEGNVFDLGFFSQLLVDHQVTLTLKNMVFKNSHNTLGRPSIRLTSQRSKLALQNVVFSLNDEFNFREGQLFIHGDVMITGTSLFTYRSAQHSYIDRNASLLFDKDITYFHAPKLALNDQWFLKDKSSVMAFDNASLFMTHTGMKLTRGALYLDNGVTVSSYAAYPNKLFNLNSLGGGTVVDTNVNGGQFSVEWSHDQQFIAVAGSNRIDIYAVGSSSVESSIAVIDSDFLVIYYIAWSHDDRYLFVAGIDLGFIGAIKVYTFNKSSLNDLTGKITTNIINATSAAWSYDNKYVLVAGTTLFNGWHALYSFNGTSLNAVVDVMDADMGSINNVALSPDNRYIALSGLDTLSTGAIKIYFFNEGILTLIGLFIEPLVTLSGFTTSIWSADSKYLFSNGNTAATLFAYRFNGLALTLVTSLAYSSAPAVNNTMKLSPHNFNIVVPEGNQQRFFEFTGSTFIPVVTIIEPAVSSSSNVVWSPDGNFIFTAGIDLSFSYLARTLYKINYRHDTLMQSIRNGLVFGDARLGHDYDLDIEVLGGARVEIDGKLLYDNVR